jgi:hypothetical protein
MAVPRRKRILLLALVALVSVPGGGYLACRHGPALLQSAGLIAIKDHPLRRAYEREVAGLADRAAELERQGMPLPEIARAMHAERRALGVKYKEMTPPALRQRIYEINLKRYGDPLGPTFAYLVQKHTRDGVTDYRAIIRSAARTNPDVDRLLRTGEDRP